MFMFQSQLLPLIELLIGPPDPAEVAIRQFEARNGTSLFTLGSDSALVRSQYAQRLRALVGNPRLLHQKVMNACGMAAFLHIWLQVDKAAVARFAIDLFEHGRATIGNLAIEPDQDLLKQSYPELVRTGAEGMPDPVDWVIMSALRNGTQAAGPRFLGTLHETLSAVVLPQEFADWLQATGKFSAVVNKGNAILQQDFAVAEALQPEANVRYVAVLMHTRMLTTTDIARECRQAPLDLGEALLALATPNHYVVLDKKIEPVGDTHVEFSFWCWADELKDCFPYKIKKRSFEENFYGAVIAVV
jgi:hypothetical protein